MKIYVASSWKNPIQPETVAALRSVGHDVYDFRNPAPGNHGFHWTEVESKPRPWDVETYRRALAHPIACEGYRADMGAMEWADACVMVLPAGRSASFELGWFVGAGKAAIVLQLGEEEPELMYRDAMIVGSHAELVGALACIHCAKPLPGEIVPPGFCGDDCLEADACRSSG